MVMQGYLNTCFALTREATMDNRLKTISAELNQMTSAQAADWLIENFPVDRTDYGDAITLIPHRSWKRSDQLRLARHYFQKIPFASPRPYEAFASFMSFDNLMKVIKEFLPSKREDIELLIYHFSPVLKKAAKTDGDLEVMRSFIAENQ
jgi:hypothetical protein